MTCAVPEDKIQTKARRLIMKLHEATVHLSKQPTNKKRRRRVEQAFEALADAWDAAELAGADNGGLAPQIVRLPEVNEIMQNLNRISSILAGGLPGSLSKVQQRFQQFALMPSVLPGGESRAPHILHHPAAPGEYCTKSP